MAHMVVSAKQAIRNVRSLLSTQGLRVPAASSELVKKSLEAQLHPPGTPSVSAQALHQGPKLQHYLLHLLPG